MRKFKVIRSIELRGVFDASEKAEDRGSIRVQLYVDDIVINAGEYMLYTILSNIDYMSRSTEFRALATPVPAEDVTNELCQCGFLRELHTMEDKDDQDTSRLCV